MSHKRWSAFEVENDSVISPVSQFCQSSHSTTQHRTDGLLEIAVSAASRIIEIHILEVHENNRSVVDGRRSYFETMQYAQDSPYPSRSEIKVDRPRLNV
jgi:hypothetical protein